jgi:hypothetical protein
MTCALCSAAVFGPLVQDGVSVGKLCERARRASADLDMDGRAAIENLCNVAMLLAAEAVDR